MIIPIGIDCWIADFLRKFNLRSMSFPFDWNVTYNGVSKCIDDNFKLFTEPLNNNRINQYDIYFHHDFLSNDPDLINKEKEKFIRRYQRLINILETSNEDIIFIRKGHSCAHHNNNCYNDITNDITDAERLDIILSNKYPQLKYKIIVFVICDKCFNYNEIYKSNSDKIDIYNIVSSDLLYINFENICRNIFNV